MKFGQPLAVSLAALLCSGSLALAQAPDKGGMGAGSMGGGAPAEKMERGGGPGGAGAEGRQPSRGMTGAPERRGADTGMSQRGERATDRGARPDGDRDAAARGDRDGDQSKTERAGRNRGQDKAAGRDRDQDKAGRDREQEKAARGRDKDQEKAARGRDSDQDKAARGRDSDQDKAARGRGKDQEKAARGRDSDQDKAARGGRDSDQGKAARQERDRDQGRAAQQRGPGREAQTQPANRVQASEKQHAEVRQHLLGQRNVERSRVNVAVNIGATVPRSVRLYPLSSAIIGFAPVYRGYSYIVLEDETICIVDPRTYVIVDVIPASTQRAQAPGPRGHLTLSAEERRLVLTSIDRNRSADISVRLALGAEVPRSVEVDSFPELVIERIPRLRGYRYVVAQDQVVIVDPEDRQVALLLAD
jgi:hypothetical protein